MTTSRPENAPFLVGLCGSPGANSSTRKTVVLALEAAQSAGARVELVDLAVWKLPFGGSAFEANDFPDAARLNALLRASDGQIWGTPEYHGSFSGVLKNALDLGSFDEYEGKAVALLGVAGGQIGAIQALAHLRTVARQLHCWCLPQQVSIARAYEAFDANGRLKDPKLAQSVENLGKELAKWAAIFAAQKMV